MSEERKKTREEPLSSSLPSPPLPSPPLPSPPLLLPSSFCARLIASDIIQRRLKRRCSVAFLSRETRVTCSGDTPEAIHRAEKERASVRAARTRGGKVGASIEARRRRRRRSASIEKPLHFPTQRPPRRLERQGILQ